MTSCLEGKHERRVFKIMLLWLVELRRNMQLGRHLRWIIREVEWVKLLLLEKVNNLKESCCWMKGR
jgi:hypothetical protein